MTYAKTLDLEVIKVKFLTKTEIADTLRVSTQTVNNWIASGILKAVDVRREGSRRPMYRVKESDLESFLSNRISNPSSKKKSRPRAAASSTLI